MSSRKADVINNRYTRGVRDLILLYRRGLRWNFWGSSGYYLLSASYFSLLFQATDSSLFGLIGTLYAIISFARYALDAGFTSSLPSFYAKSTQSRYIFESFILRPLVLQLLFIIIIASLVLVILRYTSFSINNLSFSVLTIVVILMISEWLSHVGRTLLELNFKNHIVICNDIASVLLSGAMLWAGYFQTKAVTLYLVFMPFLISSLIMLPFYYIDTVRFYRSLPPATEGIDISLCHRRIAKTRITLAINDLSKQAFSANILIPFFAFRFGLSQAGILKLASRFSTAIMKILQRTFGLTGSALLMHVSKASHQRQEAFAYMSNILFRILTLLIIMLTAIALKTSCSVACQSVISPEASLWVVYFFVINTLLGGFFITYKSLLVIEEHSSVFLFANITSMMFVYSALMLIPSPLVLLLVLIAIHLIKFLVVSMFSLHKCGVQIPSINMQSLVMYLGFALFGVFLFMP